MDIQKDSEWRKNAATVVPCLEQNVKRALKATRTFACINIGSITNHELIFFSLFSFYLYITHYGDY